MKRVLILSNHFITIYNFRKELIKKLVENGYEVYISVPKTEENDYFKKLGCTLIDTKINRRGVNPLEDFNLLHQYVNIMKRVNPDIIFSYTIKPNIYGSIAAKITGNKQISNITGTGATFIKDSAISKITKILYRLSIRDSYKVFFQNTGDARFFVKNNLVKDNFEILPGSGVNLNEFEFADLPENGIINLIFIGRVMKVKGIDEYLACAKEIKSKFKNVNFYVAGFIEEKKYEDIIDFYQKEKIIKYIGFQKNIKSWIEQCHCTVLPSHGGEGVPNVLLESAAMGRICIASDIPGSNDVVSNGKTGFLFKKENSEELIEKVEKLLGLTMKEKRKMSEAARDKVSKDFDRNIVVNKYLLEVERV